MDRPKVFLDSCVWGGTKKVLAEAGIDAIWSGEWPVDPGDEEILVQAHAEGRILVTLDKDFGELAVLRGQQHSGIVRLVGLAARQQAEALLALLEHHAEDLVPGVLVTVQSGRVRVRYPPGFDHPKVH
jgi:predicted nuclease of predicted toxin-antitoxin system